MSTVTVNRRGEYLHLLDWLRTARPDPKGTTVTEAVGELVSDGLTVELATALVDRAIRNGDALLTPSFRLTHP